MTAFTALTRTQSKVYLREPLAVFFGFVFPALILVAIGSVFPGATDPNPELGGRSLVEIYAPVGIVLGPATVALSFLLATLGGDRNAPLLPAPLLCRGLHPRRGDAGRCSHGEQLHTQWGGRTSPFGQLGG